MAVILITGAAKRIGREIAIAMAEHHKVILHYNQSYSDAQITSDIIKDNGGHTDIIQQDLCKPNAAQMLFDNALKIYNTIDIIINSASIFIPDTIESLSSELWEKHQAIHVRVPMMLTHLLYNNTLNITSKNKNKNIINIIDQRIKRPTPAFFSYTASKMFLGTLTQQCAVACSPYLRVNAISPGSTLPSIRQTKNDFEKQATLNPLEKAVTINEITNAINFIIKSPSMTGEIITLDAGQNFDWRTSSFIECKE